MSRRKSFFSKLTDPQAALIVGLLTVFIGGGLITAVVTGRFEIEKVRVQVEAEMTAEARHATQTAQAQVKAEMTAEARHATQTAQAIPSLVPTPILTATLDTSTLTPTAIDTPTFATATRVSAPTAQSPDLRETATPTSISTTACTNQTVYAISELTLYDSPGGAQVSGDPIIAGNELECIEASEGASHYLVRDSHGREGWGYAFRLSFKDPRTCFKLHVQGFPQKVGYVYRTWCTGYMSCSRKYDFDSIVMEDILGGSRTINMPDVQLIHLVSPSGITITTTSQSYIVTTNPQDRASDVYQLEDSLVLFTSDGTLYWFHELLQSGNVVTLEQVSCQEYK